MKYILYLCLLLTACSSCTYVKNYDKPHLELSGDGPYQLEISKFTWGYGMTSFNQFSGDFAKLDTKVFDLLKGKEGICKVYLQESTTDKYGKENTSMNYVGDIDITELNKFQTWEYWRKEHGIQVLLYKKFVAKPSMAMADSARDVPASLDSMSKMDTTLKITIEPVKNIQPKTYAFQITDLYPNPENQNLSEDRVTIIGYIDEVNITNGIMVIKENTGESTIVQFYPSEASSFTNRQMRLAFKEGNKFEGTVAKAGAVTVDLVSADISER